MAAVLQSHSARFSSGAKKIALLSWLPMLRITGVMREYTAKFTTRNSQRIVDYLIEPPSPFTMRKDIKTLSGPSTEPGMPVGKIPLLTATS